MKYKIAKGQTASELEGAVNTFLEDGWKLHGATMKDGEYQYQQWYQPMLLDDAPAEKPIQKAKPAGLGEEHHMVKIEKDDAGVMHFTCHSIENCSVMADLKQKWRTKDWLKVGEYLARKPSGKPVEYESVGNSYEKVAEA